MILASHGIIGSSIVQFNANVPAQEFFDRVTNAGGSLTSTEEDAILNLIIDLNNAGIWNKMKAIYPMVGASAAACAQNLKSSSFTGTFTATGWTFASTGATPNGTSAYMDTALNPSITLINNNNQISFYSRTNNDGLFIDLGVSGNGPTFIPLNTFYIRSVNQFIARAYSYDVGKSLDISNTDSRGFFVANRTSNIVLNSWKNGVKQGTLTYTNLDNLTAINRNYFLSAINLAGTASQFSNRECAFASIGEGLTDTEASDFYDAVQAFQTTLSRQV
jgi:hypothetical protein